MLAGLATVRGATAAVTTSGSVSPVPPPGGGSMAGPLVIGTTAIGSVAIGGATPLTLTTGNVVIGDGTGGVGVLTQSGLGSDFTTTGTNGDVLLGNFGSGTHTLSNLASAFIADDLTLGLVAESSGVVNVLDNGTTLDVTDTVIVGVAGSGVIEVAGGRVFTDDVVIAAPAATASDGRVTVTGTGALWQQSNSLTIGDGGRGTVQVLDGARLENTNAVLADDPGSSAIVEVDGAGSFWQTTGFVTLGGGGRGDIGITNGGRATVSGSMTLGVGAGVQGYMVVSGVGSSLQLASFMVLGNFGQGTVNVLDGGRITSTSVNLSNGSGSRGEVVIDGAGSRWELTSVAIGGPGDGKVTLSNGGVLKASGATTIAPLGTLTFAGGRFESTATSGQLLNSGVIEGSGEILAGTASNQSSGRIRLSAGHDLRFSSNLTNAGEINLINGGTLRVGGTLSNTNRINGRGTIVAGSVANSSSVSLSGGFTDVFGGVTNTGSILVTGGSTTTFYNNVANNAPGSINVAANSAVVFLGSLTGGGTLTGSGTKYFSDGSSSPAVLESAGDTVVESPASVTTGRVREDELTVIGQVTITPNGGPSGTSTLNALSVAGGGRLNLTDNDLIVNYTGASPAGDVEAMVRSAYNVTGDWQGPGITSSVAAADGNFVIAVADNASLAAPFGSAQGGPLFGGFDVDLTTVLVKFTHRADINLDGVITPDDSAVFGGNYDESITSGFTWAQGDMNYDGVCTPDDAAIFGGAYDESLASLPEPASVGVLALASIALARRARGGARGGGGAHGNDA